MAMGLDEYLYCSPFLSVVSLDHMFDRCGEDDRSFDIPDPQPAADVQIDRQRAYYSIHGAVESLPPRQRAVIRAIYFSGHTVTQTAKRLKISAPAVVKLRKKGLKHLLNALTPQRNALFA